MTTQKRGAIFVISAPSGCGKTTLVRKLLDAGMGNIVRSISMTSRLPRGDERDGVDYYFVTENDFRDRIARGEFLEWEDNFGALYGTPRAAVEESLRRGRGVILNIDVKGAMKIRSAYPDDAVLIFLVPPSFGELETRLRNRKTDGSYSISRRLTIAREEMGYKEKYDHAVVNDDLGRAYGELQSIIAARLGMVS